jgi:uncharacterized membrane protein (DUF4010 family)
MISLNLLQKALLALALGLLVGLQRERSRHGDPGIRTFPLISVLGLLAGVAAEQLGGLVLAAGFLSLTLILVLHAFRPPGAPEVEQDWSAEPGDLSSREAPARMDITTEVAALVVFGVGVAVALDRVGLAVLVAGASMVLLQWKRPLHRLANRLGREDLQALSRLVLIGLVVLPVLPDRAYGPYDVLNPFEIWLMVVLIVGISMAGYVAYKVLPQGGMAVAGLLGGFISSTATTVSLSRRSRDVPSMGHSLALAIVLASFVSFVRVLVEIAVVAPSSLGQMGPPLGAMMLAMLVMSGVLHLTSGGDPDERRPERKPPSDLVPALIFGLLYALILLGVAFAQDRFGQRGLYLVAGLSGLTDLDAISLSTAQLVHKGQLPAAEAWRYILVGGMANLAFKGGAVFVLARGRLRRLVPGLFVLLLGVGVGVLALWP